MHKDNARKANKMKRSAFTTWNAPGHAWCQIFPYTTFTTLTDDEDEDDDDEDE